MAIEQIERLPDVSFIDDDINLDGIQKQMLQDYQDKYMEETGEETVLDRGEPIALILYACSVQIYQMYMYVDRAGKQNLSSTHSEPSWTTWQRSRASRELLPSQRP